MRIGPRTRDEKLLRHVARGRQEALECLHDRYAAAALGVATALLGPGEDAEAAVEAAFLRVWKAPREQHPAAGGVREWILRLVMSCAGAADPVRARSALRSIAELRRAAAG